MWGKRNPKSTLNIPMKTDEIQNIFAQGTCESDNQGNKNLLDGIDLLESVDPDCISIDDMGVVTTDLVRNLLRKGLTRDDMGKLSALGWHFMNKRLTFFT